MGSGCHLNYSTRSTRGKDGLTQIYNFLNKLEGKHNLHLLFYGDNSKRLCGDFETSKKEFFTYGVGDRSASCRIPT